MYYIILTKSFTGKKSHRWKMVSLKKTYGELSIVYYHVSCQDWPNGLTWHICDSKKLDAWHWTSPLQQNLNWMGNKDETSKCMIRLMHSLCKLSKWSLHNTQSGKMGLLLSPDFGTLFIPSMRIWYQPKPELKKIKKLNFIFSLSTMLKAQIPIKILLKELIFSELYQLWAMIFALL